MRRPPKAMTNRQYSIPVPHAVLNIQYLRRQSWSATHGSPVRSDGSVYSPQSLLCSQILVVLTLSSCVSRPYQILFLIPKITNHESSHSRINAFTDRLACYLRDTRDRCANRSPCQVKNSKSQVELSTIL